MTRYQLRYNRVRAFGGIRTLSLVRTKDALHLVSFEGMRAARGSRTPNTPGLNRRPLPLGYRGERWGSRTRTSTTWVKAKQPAVS